MFGGISVHARETGRGGFVSYHRAYILPTSCITSMNNVRNFRSNAVQTKEELCETFIEAPSTSSSSGLSQGIRPSKLFIFRFFPSLLCIQVQACWVTCWSLSDCDDGKGLSQQLFSIYCDTISQVLSGFDVNSIEIV